jgi:hypothetical protein
VRRGGAVVEVLEGQGVASHFNRTRRLQTGEEPLGAGDVDFTGDPSGNELDEQGMQSTRGPVASPAQIGIALRQQPQHTGMVRARHRREARCSQRRDGHRQRVVGIVLVRPTRAQDPHPRRPRRRHVEDRLARGNKLLGQQIPQATRGLDRPRPLLERRRPPEQLVELAAPRPHPHLRELRFVAADSDCCVRPLVGINADHHAHCVLLDPVE